MIKITCRHNRGRLKSAKETKVEKNENRDFYRHIFNSIFLLTRHSSVSKSYPETESLESTSKCRGRKSFHTWYYIVFCATICVRFSSKSKTTFFFPKQILKSKARVNQFNQGKKCFVRCSKELFMQRFA